MHCLKKIWKKQKVFLIFIVAFVTVKLEMVKGKLVKQGKFLGVPNYKDREINVGSVFHVETYGLEYDGVTRQSIEQTRALVSGVLMLWNLKSKL